MILATLAAGCGNEGAENEEEASGEEQTDTIVVEHEMGTAEIEEEPERIVTLHQSATDTAVALDIQPVGAVESWVEQPMYEYLRDDLEGTAIVGDEIQPNLEELDALDPDVIVGGLVRHEEVYEQLEQIAPTVITDPINDFEHTLEMVGQAADKEEEAEELQQDWDNRVAEFRSQAEDEMGEEWPLSSSALNIRSDQVRMFMGGFPGKVLEQAGFAQTDIQEEGLENEEEFIEFTNTESIPEMDADVFFIFTQGNQEDDEIEEAMEQWTGHPLWEELTAVANEHVYMKDEVIWSMGGGIIAANHMLDDLYETFDFDMDE
ncbi:ABC transporter substrate-binding protein [Salsuginibacillus kocurii]|uniref:ABC transporter substrate-binding protein n=1 Tax=Salsuginibacillus kocurii TaxID=427078 RepID=UPI001F0A531C|nr:iron-siderophore ABC transporter substrate-binding protein [Salsuginibacillus kocurii]